MIDGTFIEQLRHAITGPKTLEVNGEEQLVLPAGWQAPKREIPRAGVLTVHSLTALVDYVKTRRDEDELALTECFVHVKDPVTVELRGQLEGVDVHYRRQHYVTATVAIAGPTIPFGQYVDAETFIVGLQAGFSALGDRDSLVSFVAAIRESTVTDTTDDGYAQKVNVAEGVVFVGDKKVPNPVTLAPRRTFLEVGQPESPFVLRLKSSNQGRPHMALFEADGGHWKLVAIERVAAYLRDKLGDAVTVLG